MSELNKIKEQVEQRLQEQQASKEFKDVGRVANTKKERSAYKLITSKILTDLEEDSVMAYNMTKKENVWVEIDVKSEKERGVTSGATYLKVKIRESVPTRPKDDKNIRRSYVLFLEDLQTRLFNCFNVAQISQLVSYYRSLPINEIIGIFINSEYLNASAERKLEIEAGLKKNKNIALAFLYGSSSLVKKIINEIYSARFENTLFNTSEASYQIWNDAKEKEPISKETSKELIDKLNEREKAFIEANKKKIDEYQNFTEQELKARLSDWRSLDPLWKKDMSAFRRFAINYYERRVAQEEGVYKKKREASLPKDNDWSWFEKVETKDEGETKKSEPRETINSKPPLSYIKRTGGYKIENLTPSEIVDTFGFNAVNYGNYVDDKWSKEHTKHFLEAICDMAEMLNIDIKKVNQLGKLSIAFGSKGTKGHMASYFPQTKDINLTKANGDGSVAHEWGHYFDNVIVEKDLKRATNGFASEGLAEDYELKPLFKELSDFIIKGNPQYTPLLPCRFYAKKSTSEVKNLVWDGRMWNQKSIEMKSTIDETIQQVIADNSGIGIMDANYYSTQLRIFGYIIDSFGLQEHNIPLRLKTSYLYHKTAYRYFAYCYKETDTKIVTALVKRSNYWTSIVELFARSWETVILKKLIDKGRVSNYLVDSIPTEDIIAEGYNKPYPSGKELDYLENIIDRIVMVFKKRFMIGDFEAPSSTRADVYVDYKGKESGLTGDGMVVEKDKKGNKEVDFVENGEVVAKVEETPKIEASNIDVKKDIMPQEISNLYLESANLRFTLNALEQQMGGKGLVGKSKEEYENTKTRLDNIELKLSEYEQSKSQSKLKSEEINKQKTSVTKQIFEAGEEANYYDELFDKTNKVKILYKTGDGEDGTERYQVKFENGQEASIYSDKLQPIKEEQKIEVEKVEEPTEQDIKDTIAGLEVLADMGFLDARDTVEALKLLI